jgi:hypothetical protein
MVITNISLCEITLAIFFVKEEGKIIRREH